MFDGFCHFGNWGPCGNIGVWGWVGFILNLALWVGLLVGLILLVVWTARRARVPAATVASKSGQSITKEILQTRYARGEITREQYQHILDDVR
jgi:putative membrane protein